VNTAINKMIKSLVLVAVVALVGCASRPEKTYYPADMKNFVANCGQAKTQVDFLSQKIDEYSEYHRTHPPTLEDRRYYGHLKNNLWSLRSSCSVLQR
jgi:outer membrane murein-binding lipoprotein Lpp